MLLSQLVDVSLLRVLAAIASLSVCDEVLLPVPLREAIAFALEESVCN